MFLLPNAGFRYGHYDAVRSLALSEQLAASSSGVAARVTRPNGVVIAMAG